MSDPVIRATYANSGARAYDDFSPAGDCALWSVKLPSGARFTMLKPGNAEGCETTMNFTKGGA